MSVCKKKGWFIASIGRLSACDHDRLAAMRTVTLLFQLECKPRLATPGG
jgi:hypothetical protein